MQEEQSAFRFLLLQILALVPYGAIAVLPRRDELIDLAKLLGLETISLPLGTADVESVHELATEGALHLEHPCTQLLK